MENTIFTNKEKNWEDRRNIERKEFETLIIASREI